MAGQESFLLEGGMSQPSIGQVAASGRNLPAGGGGAPEPRFSVIALVLLAVAVLWALDKFGFRFAVTAGKR